MLLILLLCSLPSVMGEGKVFSDAPTSVVPPIVGGTTPIPGESGIVNVSAADMIQNGSFSASMPDIGGLVVNAAEDNDDEIIKTFLQSKENKTAENITRADLRGATLRVVAIREPPYVNYLNMTPEAEESYGYGPGVVLQILGEISKRLGVDFDIVEPTDGSWGEFVNGSWNGMIGMLARRQVDVLAGAMIVRYDRHQVVDFSFPFMASETGMLIRSPDRYVDNTFLIVTRPFSWQVWILIIVSIIVSGMILKCFTRALAAASEIQYTLLGSIWVFFSVFVQQGLPIQPKSWTCRTMLAFWWLAALTLVASFTGNMVALFAVDKTSLPFNTKEGMVDRVEGSGYTVVMDSSSFTRTMFIKNSKQKLFQRLWYEMDTNKKLTYVDNLQAGVEIVKNFPKTILLGPIDVLRDLAATDCDVTVLKGTMIPAWFSICLQKYSRFTKIFSEEIRQLVEKGFIVKWMQDYAFVLASKRGKRCIYQEGISTKGTPINLERAQGAFWIVVAGLALGIIGLFWEYILRGIIRVGSWMGIDMSFLSCYLERDKALKRHRSDGPHMNERGDLEGPDGIVYRNGVYPSLHEKDIDGEYTNDADKHLNATNLKRRKGGNG